MLCSSSSYTLDCKIYLPCYLKNFADDPGYIQYFKFLAVCVFSSLKLWTLRSKKAYLVLAIERKFQTQFRDWGQNNAKIVPIPNFSGTDSIFFSDFLMYIHKTLNNPGAYFRNRNLGKFGSKMVQGFLGFSRNWITVLTDFL